MNASDYLARELARRGVTHVFEIAGGMITFLLDALRRHGGVRLVSMHHEQAAGFAAEGFGRITGVPGVALATSGPGATNLLTAIGSCYFDSVPAVFITGQVNRHERKGDRAVRQLGFQETDIVAVARPLVKAAWSVESADDLPRLLADAFSTATSGRPGPVLLDIPMDVQRAPIAPAALQPLPATAATADDPSLGAFLAELRAALRTAQRPLILAGGGINSARVRAEFLAAVDATGLPVVQSLLAVDTLPASHPARVGFIGSYGNRWANLALAESDLLLVLGSRLDVRQTGSDVAGFKGARAVFHVDCEPGEVNHRVTGCRPWIGELAPFLRAFARESTSPAASTLAAWFAQLAALRARWPDTAEITDLAGINPNAFFHQLAAASQPAAAYTADVGQHQMWAAQSLDLVAGQRFLTSGGMGAMGSGLPFAIGAAFATGRPVVAIAGDGGFQLNLQELQTIVRHRLPVKIVILNNGALGMVRQFQDSYFHGRRQSTVDGYSAPSFTAIARAYGIEALEVSAPAEVDAALAALWRSPAAPFLLEVKIDLTANAYPKLAFGRPFGEMEPLARPLEMEGT